MRRSFTGDLEGQASAAEALANSPTVTSPAMMTEAGIILGTAGYMAPEQAKGKPADKRSDIWAFGCVLYEMLTGQRAFEGEDVSDTLANVLKLEPNWDRLPDATPPAIVCCCDAVCEERSANAYTMPPASVSRSRTRY